MQPRHPSQPSQDHQPFKKALILEDIESSNHWMSERLRDAFPAIQVDQAFNLRQAWQYVKPTQHYDIALIDLGLPDGSGLELIEYCSQHYPQLLMVVVTIFEDDQHLFKAVQLGAQGYLLKDMEAEPFAQNLMQIAQGHAVLSPLFIQKIMQYMRQLGQSAACKSLPIVLPLTRREKEVLACLGRGLQVNETAEQLGISVHTAASYVKEIYRKLNISSRAEAVMVALQYGLV